MNTPRTAPLTGRFAGGLLPKKLLITGEIIMHASTNKNMKQRSHSTFRSRPALGLATLNMPEQDTDRRRATFRTKFDNGAMYREWIDLCAHDLLYSLTRRELRVEYDSHMYTVAAVPAPTTANTWLTGVILDGDVVAMHTDRLALTMDDALVQMNDWQQSLIYEG